ncbi:MAG: NAD-dependent epimerase/dehydratase:3-beta hydroxysteroid dehydrogenase/isomerase:dTDP-4-dehydrorhamnose reductase, partial [uncultured bacterium]
QKVASACVKNNVMMIMASSTSVYGTQENIIDENCAPEELKPQSPYAKTKLLEETFVQNLCEKNKLRAIIFRFGTIFGVSPGMRFHTAVNKFCWQAVMQQPLTVWSTAYHQKRPYLALSDATAAIVLMIQRNQFDGKVYNVVTNNITVSEVVETIKKYVPNLTVNFVDNQIMNQLSYEVLNTRLQSLGFKPTGNFQIGISDTMHLFR